MSYQSIAPAKRKSQEQDERYCIDSGDRQFVSNKSSINQTTLIAVTGSQAASVKSIPKPYSTERGRNREPEQGFKEYFNSKIQKLREQFDVNSESAELSNTPQRPSGIFAGISVWVDGFTSPSSSEVKVLMLAHGGRFEHYFETGAVTHIIADQLAETHILRYRRMKRPLPVVRAQWIADSCARGELLDPCPYLLSRVAADDGQAVLSRLWAAPSIPCANISIGISDGSEAAVGADYPVKQVGLESPLPLGLPSGAATHAIVASAESSAALTESARLSAAALSARAAVSQGRVACSGAEGAQMPPSSPSRGLRSAPGPSDDFAATGS